MLQRNGMVPIFTFLCSRVVWISVSVISRSRVISFLARGESRRV